MAKHGYPFDYDEVFEKAMKLAKEATKRNKNIGISVGMPTESPTQSDSPDRNQPTGINERSRKHQEVRNRKVRRGKNARSGTIGTRGMRMPSTSGGRAGRNRLRGRFKTDDFNQKPTSRQGTGMESSLSIALEQELLEEGIEGL